jgi:hypothetical protein
MRTRNLLSRDSGWKKTAPGYSSRIRNTAIQEINYYCCFRLGDKESLREETTDTFELMCNDCPKLYDWNDLRLGRPYITIRIKG